MIGPVIGHVPCALDHQRRIHEAGAERVARATVRYRRRRREDEPFSLPGPSPARGEDVWQALRF